MRGGWLPSRHVLLCLRRHLSLRLIARTLALTPLQTSLKNKKKKKNKKEKEGTPMES
jgi:hypothetical protein